MKILIATENVVKVEACQAAFEEYFDEVEVEAVSVPSEVGEMPLNDEIGQGTKNRIQNLKEYAKENHLSVDYYVAVESGINNYFESWMITSVTALL